MGYYDCDICKSGTQHDYLPNQYWCSKYGALTIEGRNNCTNLETDKEKKEFMEKLEDIREGRKPI